MNNQDGFPKIMVLRNKDNKLKSIGIDFDMLINVFGLPSSFFEHITNMSSINLLADNILCNLEQHNSVKNITLDVDGKINVTSGFDKNKTKLMGDDKMENTIKLGQVYKMKEEGIYTIPVSFAKSDYSDKENKFILMILLNTTVCEEEYDKVNLTYLTVDSFKDSIKEECCDINASVLDVMSSVTASKVLINPNEKDNSCYKIIDPVIIEDKVEVVKLPISQYISNELKIILGNILCETPWDIINNNNSICSELTIPIMGYITHTLKTIPSDFMCCSFKLGDTQTIRIFKLDKDKVLETKKMNVKEDSLELYVDGNGISIFAIEFVVEFIFDTIKRGN